VAVLFMVAVVIPNAISSHGINPSINLALNVKGPT
jgi:hypothetical protein